MAHGIASLPLPGRGIAPLPLPGHWIAPLPADVDIHGVCFSGTRRSRVDNRSTERLSVYFSGYMRSRGPRQWAVAVTSRVYFSGTRRSRVHNGALSGCRFTSAAICGHGVLGSRGPRGFTSAALGGHGFTTGALSGCRFTSAAICGHGVLGSRGPRGFTSAALG